MPLESRLSLLIITQELLFRIFREVTAKSFNLIDSLLRVLSNEHF